MFEVIWSDEAKLVYFKTLNFWTEHNKSNAYSKKIILNVEKKEALLSTNPFIGEELRYRDARGLRVLKFFSLIYRIRNSKVYILSFWDNRRNPENLEIK